MNNSNPSENNYQKKVQLLQRVGAVSACLIMLAVFGYFYTTYGKQLYNIFGNSESLKAFLSQFNGFDKLVFVAIRAFQTVIKIIPAEPLEIGSGVLYGTWGGLFLCMLGTMIGSFIIIALTKVFGRSLVSAFIPIEKIESMKFLRDEKKVYFTLFFIYLIPGTPKDLLTYFVPLTKMKLSEFLFISMFARIPSVVSSTIGGDFFGNGKYLEGALLFVATGAISLLGILIYRKILAKYHERKEKKEDA